MLAEVGSSLIYSTICLKYHLYLKNFLPNYLKRNHMQEVNLLCKMTYLDSTYFYF